MVRAADEHAMRPTARPHGGLIRTRLIAGRDINRKAAKMHHRDQFRSSREQAVARELKKVELRQARQLGSPHHRVITELESTANETKARRPATGGG